MAKLEVAVSPHYRGRGWTDRGTGIEFSPQTDSTLNTRTINKDKYDDLTGIKNSIRLNHLLVIKGEIGPEVADTPTKTNPEELTGEELDAIIADGGSADQALTEENNRLKDELATEKQETTRLQGELDAEKQETTRIQGELDTANTTITEHEAEIARLQKELENATSPDPSPATLSLDGYDSSNVDSLKDDKTKAELQDILDENKIEYNTNDTKADLVSLIAENLK